MGWNVHPTRNGHGLVASLACMLGNRQVRSVDNEGSRPRFGSRSVTGAFFLNTRMIPSISVRVPRRRRNITAHWDAVNNDR